MSQEVQEMRHDLRNMRMIVDGQAGLIRDLEVKYNTLHTKVYTSMSVFFVVASVGAFFVNIYLSL